MAPLTGPTNWPLTLFYLKTTQKYISTQRSATQGEICTRLSIRGPPPPCRGALSVSQGAKMSQKTVTKQQNLLQFTQKFTIYLVCIVAPPTGPTNWPPSLILSKNNTKIHKHTQERNSRGNMHETKQQGPPTPLQGGPERVSRG